MSGGRRRPADRAVLVLNAGSSTLKAALLPAGGEEPLAAVTLDWPGVDPATAGERLGEALDRVGAGERPLLGVGHRIVHGGPDLTAPRVLDDGVIEALRTLVPLAPLHLPPSLALLDAARERLPALAHVACFDTAFHAGLPEIARRYPLPVHWAETWGYRRYGFHGLSVEWAVGRAAALLGRPERALRLVVAHLGAGSSITAVDRGRSVDTSMGYTPLEGLMMATRSGSVDPGILLAALRDRRLDAEGLADELQHRSGLLGVGGSADMRELLHRRSAGDDAAALAIDQFVDRAAAAIGAAATRLPGLDAVVFTGGIGEHAGQVRAAIVRRLAVLGVPAGLGAGRRGAAGDAVLTPAGARPAVLRVTAREDLVIARAVERLAASV